MQAVFLVWPLLRSVLDSVNLCPRSWWVLSSWSNGGFSTWGPSFQIPFISSVEDKMHVCLPPESRRLSFWDAPSWFFFFCPSRLLSSNNAKCGFPTLHRSWVCVQWLFNDPVRGAVEIEQWGDDFHMLLTWVRISASYMDPLKHSHE